MDFFKAAIIRLHKGAGEQPEMALKKKGDESLVPLLPASAANTLKRSTLPLNAVSPGDHLELVLVDDKPGKRGSKKEKKKVVHIETALRGIVQYFKVCLGLDTITYPYLRVPLFPILLLNELC